jgi:hypothetical protein
MRREKKKQLIRTFRQNNTCVLHHGKMQYIVKNRRTKSCLSPKSRVSEEVPHVFLGHEKISNEGVNLSLLVP